MAPPKSFIIFGASGDLAHTKTYPALFRLASQGYLPPATSTFVGFARSEMTKKQLQDKIRDKLQDLIQNIDDKTTLSLYDAFLDRCDYVRAKDGYAGDKGYEDLNAYLENFEKEIQGSADEKPMRLFYLALPPTQFEVVATMIRKHCWPSNTVNRLLLEKPYGLDYASARQISRPLAQHYSENDLYRVDHYLAKNIIHQILALRFSDTSTGLSSLFSREHVSHVVVRFTETKGVEGRGGYFDQAGIVRDVVANHVMQFIAAAAMEPPKAFTAEAMTTSRLNFIKAVDVVEPNYVWIGQYVGHPTDKDKKGYKDDDTVREGSKTPTFAACVFTVSNQRWYGVPFVVIAGKALDENRVDMTLHFKKNSSAIFTSSQKHKSGEKGSTLLEATSNCLVLSDKPTEAVILHSTVKRPGYGFETLNVAFTLDFKHVIKDIGGYQPDPYEALFLHAINGDHTWFVGREEAEEQWRVWKRYLAEVERKWEPSPYAYGSEGPEGVIKALESAVETEKKTSEIVGRMRCSEWVSTHPFLTHVAAGLAGAWAIGAWAVGDRKWWMG